jgi:hypothetical protein
LPGEGQPCCSLAIKDDLRVAKLIVINFIDDGGSSARERHISKIHWIALSRFEPGSVRIRFGHNKAPHDGRSFNGSAAIPRTG